MHTHNPCNFWSKYFVWTFNIYSKLRFFFKFPYNFCRDFRQTCNHHDNYMHFTGYPVQHGVSSHFLRGQNLQCSILHWKENQKDSNDFWHKRFHLKVRFWHFFDNQSVNGFKKYSGLLWGYVGLPIQDCFIKVAQSLKFLSICGP